MPQPNQVPQLIKGKVKWFSNQKGHGFLIRDDTGEDIFVHHTGIDEHMENPELVQGWEVEFAIVPDMRKRGSYKAVGVRIARKG